jgi:citrate lyase subunit beta/citryl-CoA lyase
MSSGGSDSTAHRPDADHETPPGCAGARDRDRSPRVVASGTGDLAAATGLRAETGNLVAVRTMLLLAAAEAGVDALDSAFTGIADLPGYERDADMSRGLGFRGKSCIHPTQVPVANRVFQPSARELAEARALVDAYDAAVRAGIGAFTHEGRLVDLPIAEAARALIVAAEA